MATAKDLFSGITINWGFTPADIFSNGMTLVASLALFILLGVAMMYVRPLINLIKDAVRPS